MVLLTYSRPLFLVMGPLLLASFLPFIVPAFAQEEVFVNRRVEIWTLFYNLMIAAFVVGAVVQGAMVFIAVRFREGKKMKQEVAR